MTNPWILAKYFHEVWNVLDGMANDKDDDNQDGYSSQSLFSSSQVGVSSAPQCLNDP